MAMKKLLSLFVITGLLIIVNQPLTAQEEKVANKLFYVELGGPGVIMSVNFDSRFNSNERLGIGYRLGVGYGVEKFENVLVEFLKDVLIEEFGGNYFENVKKTFYSIPIGLNYVVGNPKKTSIFEIGTGVTFLSNKVSLYNYEDDKPGSVIGHLSFMYRFVPVNSGFSFRVGFTPIIGTAGDLCPMGAIGFGYAF